MKSVGLKHPSLLINSFSRVTFLVPPTSNGQPFAQVALTACNRTPEGGRETRECRSDYPKPFRHGCATQESSVGQPCRKGPGQGRPCSARFQARCDPLTRLHDRAN